MKSFQKPFQTQNPKMLKAVQLHQKGDIRGAKKLYLELLKINPRNDLILSFIGLIDLSLNDFDNALKYIQQAVRINPNPQYFKDLGDIYLKKKEPEKAIEIYQKILEEKSKKSEKSESSENPESSENLDIYSEVYYSLGLAYSDLEEHETAILHFQKAIAPAPDFEEAIFNMGSSLYKLNRTQEAFSCYMKSLELNPHCAETYQAVGTVLYDMNRIDDSIKCFEAALKLKPYYPDAFFNLSYSLLKNGDIEKGFELYEHRFAKTQAVSLPHFSKPRWNGTTPSGTLFVFMEQGLGDALMFSRYFPVLKNLGLNLISWVPDSLTGLFKYNFPYVTFVSRVEDLKDDEYDFYVPSMSLPFALKTTRESIPRDSGHIKPLLQKVEEYKNKYFNDDEDCFKIGLVWQCKNKYYKDVPRSIPDVRIFEKLNSLNNVKNLKKIKFYSLQKSEAESQIQNLPESFLIEPLGHTFNDFCDTSGAIENLDLLLSVDTSVVHLGAALNKKTWVLLAMGYDWRWLSSSNKSLWYESVKSFKQPDFEDWDSVINEVKNELELLLAKND